MKYSHLPLVVAMALGTAHAESPLAGSSFELQPQTPQAAEPSGALMIPAAADMRVEIKEAPASTATGTMGSSPSTETRDPRKFKPYTAPLDATPVEPFVNGGPS